MKVVCVYKSGGDYDARYVENLAQAVHRYIHCNFDFVCLTDRPREVENVADVIELQHDLPGWWSKIELFNPKILYDDVILYFDLDVLLMKDLDDLVDVANASFYPLFLRSADLVGKSKDWPSTSIMSWKGQMMEEVYKKFFRIGPEKVVEELQDNTFRAGQRTDQGFVRTVINPPEKFQDLLPGGYILYKRNYLRYPSRIKRAHILNWTGKPRFHNMDRSKEMYEFINLWDNQEQWKLNDHQY